MSRNIIFIENKVDFKKKAAFSCVGAVVAYNVTLAG
jgi:hypothetical protein